VRFLTSLALSTGIDTCGGGTAEDMTLLNSRAPHGRKVACIPVLSRKTDTTGKNAKESGTELPTPLFDRTTTAQLALRVAQDPAIASLSGKSGILIPPPQHNHLNQEQQVAEVRLSCLLLLKNASQSKVRVRLTYTCLIGQLRSLRRLATSI
jgi:hypothetical protein